MRRVLLAVSALPSRRHGIGIYPVSKETTRDDITAQLCPHDPVTNE